jgi:hypothetical protein
VIHPSQGHLTEKVALVLIVFAAEMSQPQKAEPEPHKKSEPPEHHFKKAEIVALS